MISTNPLRVLSLALVAIATAAPAQYVTIPQGAPMTPTIPPGPVGVPGGRSGTTAQGMGDADMQRDLRSRSMAERKTASKDAAHPATASDLAVGAAIADSKGVQVGYIKSIDPDGVVVATVGGQVKVPSDALGKNQKGLLIGMTKADFDKLVAQAMGG